MSGEQFIDDGEFFEKMTMINKLQKRKLSLQILNSKQKRVEWDRA